MTSARLGGNSARLQADRLTSWNVHMESCHGGALIHLRKLKTVPIRYVLSKGDAKPGTGLSLYEAAKPLQQYGYSEIRKHQISTFLKLLSY
jgi:hypothetical protein